jgi:hypothetical protein
MVYNTELLGFWTFSIVRYSREQKTRRFGNWIFFRPQVTGKKTPTRLGPLERANLNHWTTPVWVWVLCYDRRSVGQSVLEQSTHLGLTTRSWLLSDSCGFVGLRRPLWREDGSAVCNCNWPSPAQSFSGPSPVGLVAILYCLRFETSLFAASYDSQGHGGGIRPRLHTGDNPCHIYTVI